MTPLLGMNAKVYIISDWDTARSSWGDDDGFGYAAGPAPSELDAEIDTVNDTVDTSLTRGQANATTRGNNGWKATLGTLKDAEVRFKCVYDFTNLGFTVLMQVYSLGVNVAVAVLDGDKDNAGTAGIWADWQVVSAVKSEPMEEVQTVEFTLKPALTDVPPELVYVPGIGPSDFFPNVTTP